MCNNKIEENKDEELIKNNGYSQLNNIIGDNEEVVQVLQEAAIKDNKYEEKIKSKKIEKQVELYHIDNAQLGNLDQTIQTFADADKNKKSTSELKIPSHIRQEDCDEVNYFSDNDSQVDDCHSTSCYEESNCSSDSDESKVLTDFEEWKKWKI